MVKLFLSMFLFVLSVALLTDIAYAFFWYVRFLIVGDYPEIASNLISSILLSAFVYN